MADHTTHSGDELRDLVNGSSLREVAAKPVPSIVTVGLEASRAATAKMLDFYKRMGIRVTPEMTLAPEPKRRSRRKTSD